MKIAEEVAVGMNITHHGKKRFNLESHYDDKTLWSIHSSVGQSESLDVARNMKGLSPCSSVAIHVSKTEYEYRFHPLHSNTENGIQGHLFCYLPLPIASGLPVQVNGGFAVNSSRQALQEVSEDDKNPYSKEALWNTALLKDSVAKSYLGALSDLTKKIASTSVINTWFTLWPTFDASDGSPLKSSCLRSLVESFYERITNDGKQWKIFPSDQGWLSWDDIAFLDQTFYKKAPILDAAIHVSKLFYVDRTIVSIPLKTLCTFEETGMQQALEASVLDVGVFLRQVFFPNLSHPEMKLAERDTLLLFCLDNIDREDIKTLLENSACIPTYPNGKVRKPKDLVERNSIVGALYSDEDEVFPMGKEFESHLNSLRQLGMSSSQITWENLLERAKSVEALSLASMELACQRTRKVCKFLEKKVKSKDIDETDSLIKRFKSVKFLPILERNKLWSNLKWGGDNTGKFLSGEEIYPQRLCNLVGCNAAVMDETDNGCAKVKKDVLNFLGICQTPTIEQVMTQFETIITHVNSSILSNRDHAETIDAITGAIYKFIDEKREERGTFIKQRLSLREIILVCGRFVDPKYVSFELSFEASPYLYKLPGKLTSNFPMLMEAFGVEREFDSNIFVKVLQEIGGIKQSKPLDDKELELVLNIINNNMLKNVKDSEETPVIHLPDSQGILCESRQLCIKDVTWMPDEPGIRYVHKSISPFTALDLGALTRRHSFVIKNSLGLPFGQHENLTHRLRRIMEGYPCDKGILKELLQNADDACATELHFVLDPREHGEDRLFSEKWKPLQGPALLVYNNSCFTEEDIKGIQNLGEGSKQMDPARTGQYGIGFNVVYHLTDAPSFLTFIENRGDVLCFFDPQCRYFEGATDLEPGRMFTNARHLMSNSFTDVYSGYLPEIFGEEKSTIFRLPLRNVSMASDSNISSKVVSPDNIRELMRQFKDEAEEVVLFLNHVKQIRISEVDSKTGKLKDTFSVDVKMSPENMKTHENFVKESLAMADSIKNIYNDIPLEQLTNSEIFSYDMKVITSKGSAQDWRVVQKIGFMDESSISNCIKEHIIKGDLCLLPKGGIAFPRLQKCSTKKMKAFCLLPLPLETELPVHVNGHFILDHEARRNLWYDEGAGYKSEWNQSMIKNVIVPCYTFSIMKDTQRIPVNCTVNEAMRCLSKFFETFPDSAKVNDVYWKELSTGFYQQLVQEYFPVMPVVRPAASKRCKDKRKSEGSERVLIEWQWSVKENIVLLVDESLQMNTVYRNLQLRNCSLIDLYCNIIFVRFEALKIEEMAKHLRFVMWNCLNNEKLPEMNKARILNAMKYLKFLTRGDDLLQAKDFYDPINPVFKEMLPSNFFPPAPYSAKFWLEVLRMIGLVQNVSSDMFYKFVIEVSGQEDKEKVKIKSTILLEHLLDNPQLKKDQCLLNNISIVPFLVSDKVPREFTDISPPHVAENCLIALKGAVRSKTWETSWTVCTLLPSYVRILTRLPFNELGVREDIELLEVVKHLMNVINSKQMVSRYDGLKAIPDSYEFRTVLINVVTKCYEVTNKYQDNLNPDTVKLLRDAACILVDNDRKLAKPSLTTTEDKAIKPYIWNVSVALGKYFGLFQKLGVTKHLSAVQIADVLKRIKEECHDSILDPNRQECVYLAIPYLVMALRREHGLASNVLYLPTASISIGIELVKSTDLLYMDDLKFDNRLQNFAARYLISELSFDSDEDTQTDFIKTLMEHLPDALRPKYLSHVIHEKLVKADPKECHLSNQLIETLQSAEFSKGLARLVKDQKHHDSKKVADELEHLTMLLHNIRTITVQEISTALFYEDKEITGSQMKSEVFVDNSDPSALKIYISEDAECDLDTCSEIAGNLAKAIGKLFSDTHYIAYLVSLLMKRPEDISVFLDKRGICRDPNTEKPEDKLRLPLPGEYVPLELYHLLRNEFDDFEEDEYVAFEVEDPSMDGDSGEAVCIFAKVVQKIEEKGPLQSIYRIRVSTNSEKDVCVTELYKFSYPDKILEGAVVPYTGLQIDTPDKSPEEVLEEITTTLEEAWKLPEIEKKRVIKRLYLRWHPDKNPPEKEEFCNEVCKHIQVEVQRLYRGLPRQKKGSYSSSPRYNPYNNPFDDLFSNWNTRVKRHFSSRQSYERSYFGSSRSHQSFGRRNFGSSRSHRSWVPPTFEAQNPQPGEANRWYQQAKYDFAASSSDFQSPSYEWTCFKCHQV